MRRFNWILFAKYSALTFFVSGALIACGGGGSSGASDSGSAVAAVECSGHCADTPTNLTAADVTRVLQQAVAEAKARNANATIAVVDRVGNVLAVFRMNPTATHNVLISSQSGVTSGLDGLHLPTVSAPLQIEDQAAIAKAITGAYLSSEGNAFSTRTASQIVQAHFNPGELDQPAGPLFGVQFSQLACSDFIQGGTGIGAGPKQSPLGLSADPGGFPLYKNGTVVGGVGVMADGVYGLDATITDSDRNLDELIAWAATYNFAAPVNHRADHISVGGKLLRFSDIDFGDLASNPATAPTLTGSDGVFASVPGYFSAGVALDGKAFGQSGSGIIPDATNFPGLDAFIFADSSDANRFPATAATDSASALSAAEVQTLLEEALKVANHARAQIRQPLDSQARVTISVVDSNGVVLGMVRTRDAPVFGADVSLQKARTAALFSSPQAASIFNTLPPARYLDVDATAVGFSASVAPSTYVTAAQNFIGVNALSDGTAFTDRAGGNLSRPYFPDGINGNNPGPFSKPAGQWSPFSTGLQLDLSINAILQHVLHTAGLGPDVTKGCGGVALDSSLSASSTLPASGAERRLANGTQIFPGSVPIYRGSILVGGIGVSGDGVDQDDMISFLGLYNAGVRLNNAIGNAPQAIRADTLSPQGTRLRYVQCPFTPFLDSNQQNVCDGI